MLPSVTNRVLSKKLYGALVASVEKDRTSSPVPVVRIKQVFLHERSRLDAIVEVVNLQSRGAIKESSGRDL